MRKEWSSKWVSSTQPRKQRKYVYNAPLHAKRKLLSAHLSKELSNRFGKRAIPVRKGDEVTIMRGDLKGFKGSVERVNLSKTKVYIDGIKAKKADGSEVLRPIRPSNLMITKLNLDDKKRQAAFERSGREKSKAEKTEVKKADAKPAEKKAEVKKPVDTKKETAKPVPNTEKKAAPAKAVVSKKVSEKK